ncbi:MAG: hypothetical protein LBL13_04645 [Bacteroidales bacterium]|nr:hypothetical protein [Bacteroidales bacterium]
MSNPVQAEGAARGQSVYFSFSTPNGVEQLRSSDIEDVFLPRAALRLHGVIHIERLPAFPKLTTLGVASSLCPSYTVRGLFLFIARQGNHINRKTCTTCLLFPVGEAYQWKRGECPDGQ